MDFFDVSGFVSKLERIGLKLTATSLADGTTQINKWKLPDAAEKAEEIEKIWVSAIGENQARIDALAAHLSRPIHTDGKPSAGANLALLRQGLRRTSSHSFSSSITRNRPRQFMSKAELFLVLYRLARTAG